MGLQVIKFHSQDDASYQKLPDLNENIDKASA